MCLQSVLPATNSADLFTVENFSWCVGEFSEITFSVFQINFALILLSVFVNAIIWPRYDNYRVSTVTHTALRIDWGVRGGIFVIFICEKVNTTIDFRTMRVKACEASSNIQHPTRTIDSIYYDAHNLNMLIPICACACVSGSSSGICLYANACMLYIISQIIIIIQL